MKSYEAAKRTYIKDHMVKPLKAPNIRLNALKRIEETVKLYDYRLLQEDAIFRKFDKGGFADLYMKLKGRALSGAEKSVINGLYKFSI